MMEKKTGDYHWSFLLFTLVKHIRFLIVLKTQLLLFIEIYSGFLFSFLFSGLLFRHVYKSLVRDA
jgi:hypothetical protein